MKPTTNGEWHEVPEDAYRAFLRNHPRKEHLKIGHAPTDRGDWWFAYDAEAFAADKSHVNYESKHTVAYRIRETGKEMRFWIPTKAVEAAP